MSQTALATLSAVLAWVALIAYAALGGADFGGGIWDALARKPDAKRERAAIARSMGPVWESNNIWLIFTLVVTWTAFPIVFAGVSTALFIPITLALVGIVLRGAAFSFRSNYGLEVGMGLAWGHVFSIASVAAPFLFGTIAGALASGAIRVTGPPVQVNANPWTTWTTPFALACGAFAVGLCAVLAATYLMVDSRNNNDPLLAERFRRRALWSGAVTAALGALAAALAWLEAPILWSGLIGRALPLSIAAILLGLAIAVALLRSMLLTARALVIAETACILLAWGVAQWPYLIVPDVTVDNAASPASVLGPMLVVALLGLILLVPALWYLFAIFKRQTAPDAVTRGPPRTTAAFVASLQPAAAPGSSPPGAGARAAPPNVSPRESAVSVLVASLAILAAPLLVGIYDGLRRRIRRRRNQSRRRARLHA